MDRQYSSGSGGSVRILIHKRGADPGICNLLDYDSPEDFEEVVRKLDDKGIATNIQRLFSPYSDVATMTIEGCDVALECESMGGTCFHIMRGGDNAALERIADIIQLALMAPE